LPNIVGLDVSVLSRLNGMQARSTRVRSRRRWSRAHRALLALCTRTASTVAVALLAYAFQSARRRIKRARGRVKPRSTARGITVPRTSAQAR